MRLLWIGTKPPWPPTDGGRLLAAMTLEALAKEGVEIDVVAPNGTSGRMHALAKATVDGCHLYLVPIGPKNARGVAVRALRHPVSIARHFHPEVPRTVARLVSVADYDAVHVEQVQAFLHAKPAWQKGLPVLLRAQNVESDLWRLANVLARPEARRLAVFERRAIRQASLTIALSERDATRLRTVSRSPRVVAVPPPFPAFLPAGARLPGRPPLVLMGSAGWRPNQEANRWFLREVWAKASTTMPDAVVHVFAPHAELPPLPPGVIRHPPPEESREAFPVNGVLVVPLRVGSGVRMKILEAWARGVCVVATPQAVSGLEVEDGRELLIADTGDAFAAAMQRLSRDRKLRRSMVPAGRETLALRHQPKAVAWQLIRLYQRAVQQPDELGDNRVET